MNTHATIERLLGESKIGMTAAGALVGQCQGGGPTHPSTVARWCLRGVKLPGGRVVRLEHYRVGSKLFTSREAIIRFIEQQTEPTADVPAPRTPTQRERAAARAAEELQRLGV